MEIKMQEFSITNISDGVELVVVPVNRFKTNEINISFSLPLSVDTASANAVAISLLSNCSEEYPDLTAINKKLSLLYGAVLVSSVKKIGENQIMSISLSSLDDRFSLDDRISTQSLDMLLSLIFKPHVDENGAFYRCDIDREKRILIEQIEAESNEKRVFALRRAEEIMFKGEPYAVNRFGTVEAVNGITESDVKQAYCRLLCNAKIRVTVVGSADESELRDKLTSAFSSIERNYIPPVEAVFVPEANEVKRECDRLDVKQGKLVLGFRVNMRANDSRFVAMRAFCDAFGGGPYSKLFASVREKLSLCYYCNARYDRNKSFIVIQCGCEEENMDKAVDEIFNQLNSIKSGDFVQEFNASKIGLSDAINSANDDAGLVCGWYANQINSETTLSPSESAELNNAVAIEEARECASLITLDTVYKLLSK